MKKPISAENKQKIDFLPSALEGTDNIVPRSMKTAFNFKGRKSPDIAQKAITALTSRSDIVYEPFMGSGAFVIAAARAGRKIVATELDNYTYHAVYSLLQKTDRTKLKKLFGAVEKEAKAEVMELYATECCGVKNYISKLLYDPETEEYFHPTPNREIKNGCNVKLIAPCPICKKRQKPFEQLDLDKINQLKKRSASRFPRTYYLENSRINITHSTGADRYDRIFTHRNQLALLILQDAILKQKSSPERDLLEQALVSSLSLARIAMYGSSTDILYHVVPYGAQEMNVWELFEEKVNCFLAFKKDFSDVLEENPHCNNRYQICLSSYQQFVSSCEPERFHLVYTDFPYTDQVPYLERNQLYRTWLNHFYAPNRFPLTDEMLTLEMVQTNAPSRPGKQEIIDYYKDIDCMFSGLGKVLKTNGLAVFTMNLGKNKYFTTLIEIINLARKNGFEYITRIGLDKNDPTIRKQAAYDNTLSKEMMVFFEKLSPPHRYWYVGTKNGEFETVSLIYRLCSKGKSLTFTQGVQAVVDHFRNKEDYFATEADTERIAQIIREYFIVGEDAFIRINFDKLYLDVEDKTDLFTKFYNYIPVLIRRLLNEKSRFTLDDLYFELSSVMCAGDPGTINQFLENPSHQRDIARLINNYCVSNGKYYEKKPYHLPLSEDAVDISTLEGGEFEQVMRALLEAEGHEDVVNTGGSGDLGVDLIARKTENGRSKLTLFQCKRWAANVGSEPMQRLVAERDRRGADAAICFTTSGFTPDGEKIAREQDVGMVDGAQVILRLNAQFPGHYYHGGLKDF